MDFIRYILTATACLSIAYCGFLLFINNRTGFHQQRMFLAASLIISLVLPATGISLKLPVISGSQDPITEGFGFTAASSGIVSVPAEPVTALLGDPGTYILIYVIVSSALLLFFAASLIRILRYYILSERKEVSGQKILVNHEISSPFSFFGWIFVPAALSIEDESNNIIVHEGIHAAQYHSADNIAVELTAALMWFNPLVWMMKRSFHLLHEYLADEGTLGRGIDRLKYQSLLLNQAAEGRLISLSSNFNTSLKKRMIMMTRNKNKMQKKGRILFMIPLSLILISTTGFINGMFPGEQSIVPVEEYITSSQFETPASVPEYQQDTIVKKTVKIRRAVASSGDVKEKDEIRVIGYGNQKSADSIVFILDGTRIKNIKTVSPDDVMSVSVLKGESATALYGSDASDGAIIITTKRNLGSESDKGEPEELVSEVPENVLYIINGENSDKSRFEQIEAGDIVSIEVFKKESVKKVTDGSYDGVIVVKTK